MKFAKSILKSGGPVIRRAASRLGRNRSFNRRLPQELGGARYPASTEGGLKHLRLDVRAVDPELTRFATDHVRSGDVIWDIGANVGLFTFAAAGLAGASGHVLAVEPDVWLAAQLVSAARLIDRRAPVEVVAAAASNENGCATFSIAEQSRATNYLGDHGAPTTGGVRYRQPVPTLTLDTMLNLARPPHILKIDVECAEIEALHGAEKILEHHRPKILIEVSKDCADEVGSILKAQGYKMFDWVTGEAVSLPTWSTLALPA